MNVDLNLVEKLVQKVMEQVDANQELTTAGDWGIFATMDEAINAAEAAQRKYLSCSMADRAKYVQVIRCGSEEGKPGIHVPGNRGRDRYGWLRIQDHQEHPGRYQDPRC